jgi:hypothetical protein
LDFPLFRYNLKRFNKYFAGVWIGLSNHHQGVDYTNFIMKSIPEARFVLIKHEGYDWRNDAVNEVLDQIKTDEPILFMEQDFFIKDASFFEKVFKDSYPFVFFMEGDRVHPAFALVAREEIEKTSRDFSAIPPKDHFGKFFDELSSGISIDELGVKNKVDYFHMNGLSQNYMSFKYGDPFYQSYQFLFYNWNCLKLPVEQHPDFLQIEQSIEAQFGHPTKHDWLGRFFPL